MKGSKLLSLFDQHKILFLQLNRKRKQNVKNKPFLKTIQGVAVLKARQTIIKTIKTRHFYKHKHTSHTYTYVITATRTLKPLPYESMFDALPLSY